MNLYEKLQTTEPGRHSVDIGEAVYRCRSALGKENVDRLSKAQAYLEKLALEEFRRGAEPWVNELAKRIADESK